jgi:hypothetical protein
VKQVKDRKKSHLSGESTKKRSILFVSSKISQARIKCERMENLDEMGHNAMFGDDDINFDLELESFGVEMGPLREPAVEHVFWAWVEDWKEEAQKKNDCVAKAQLLAKYKLVAVCADDDDDKNEAFSLEIACELIVETPKKDGIQVVHQEEGE